MSHPWKPPVDGGGCPGGTALSFPNVWARQSTPSDGTYVGTSADLSTTDGGSVVGSLDELLLHPGCEGRAGAAATKVQCQCLRPCRFRHKCRRPDCDFCHLHHATPTSFAIAHRARQRLSLDMKTDPMHGLIDSTLRWWDRSSHKRRKQALRVRNMCFGRLRELRAAEAAQDAGAAGGALELRRSLAAVRAEHERDREAPPRSLEGLYAICGSAVPVAVVVPEQGR